MNATTERPRITLPRRLTANLNPQRMAVPACLLALVLYLGFNTERFLTKTNLLNIGSGISPTAIVAMGMALLLISGNFDLSVGGIAAFCAVAGTKILNGTPLPVGIVLVLSLGALCGIVNGLIVVRIGVNSLVATLGTGYALTGIAAVMSGASPVALNSDTLPTFINGTPGGVPVSLLILIGVIIIASLISHTVAGRSLFAVGANREAARYAGVPVMRAAFMPFVITGVFTAVAAIVSVGFVSSGLPTTGSDWALAAIAGAVVGGVSISGGEGSIAAAVVGMVLIGVVQNGLVQLNINSNYQDIVLGVIIVSAVALDVRVRARLARRIAPRRAAVRQPASGVAVSEE